MLGILSSTTTAAAAAGAGAAASARAGAGAGGGIGGSVGGDGGGAGRMARYGTIITTVVLVPPTTSFTNAFGMGGVGLYEGCAESPVGGGGASAHSADTCRP